MPPWAVTLLSTGLAIVGMLTVVWLVSVVLRDASIIDPCWGTGFVVVLAVAVTLNQPLTTRGGLLLGLTTLWGLRLSLFLLWRNWGHAEDRRYKAMRDYHGPRFWWVSYFTVYLLQAVILWFVAMPLQWAAIRRAETPLSLLDYSGLALWTTGWLFETIGDWQLARFRSDPANAGRVFDRGLWRYTRHPNYFGDCCVWWGLYFIAATGGAGWTFASPLVMTILLMKVSGVTLLESTITTRRPDYADYIRRTNAFFPGPPRPPASSPSTTG